MSSASQEPLSSGSGSDMTTIRHPPAETEELALKSVQHIAQLPVVQEATSVYFRLKECNCLCKLYLNTAEWALRKAVLPVAPLQRFLHTPIHKVDDITLKGLQYVEGKFPAVTLTSQQMLENMNENIDAVKKYSASKIRDVIEASLRSLPESLVPDNVHIDGHVSCRQSATKYAQRVAAASDGIDTDSSQASDVRETKPVPRSAQTSSPVPKSAQASGPVPKSVQASDPIRKSVQASDPIRKSVQASDPIRKSVQASDPIRKSVQASDPIRKSVQASDPIRKSVQASDPIPIPIQASTINKNEK